MKNTTPADIDEYIDRFPIRTRRILKKLRQAIRKAAPKASEKISWAMPTFHLYGNLVHFAAHAKHIGFYPGPDAIVAFKKALSAFKTSKGAVQFPLDRPLPIPLVTRMVKFGVRRNLRER